MATADIGPGSSKCCILFLSGRMNHHRSFEKPSAIVSSDCFAEVESTACFFWPMEITRKAKATDTRPGSFKKATDIK